jgi:hypothetical protein
MTTTNNARLGAAQKKSLKWVQLTRNAHFPVPTEPTKQKGKNRGVPLKWEFKWRQCRVIQSNIYCYKWRIYAMIKDVSQRRVIQTSSRQ